MGLAAVAGAERAVGLDMGPALGVRDMAPQLAVRVDDRDREGGDGVDAGVDRSC